MVRIEEEFITPKQARGYASAVLSKYPPAKYGTRITTRKNRLTQFWEVSGHRFN